MQRIRNSLIFQVVSLSATGLFLLLFLQIATDYKMQRERILKNAKINFKTMENILSERIEYAMLSGKKDKIADFLMEIKGQNLFRNVRVLDADKKIRASFFSEEIGTVFTRHPGDKFMLDSIRPVGNQQDCQRCHGKAKNILGYTHFTTSLEESFSELYSFLTWHIIAGMTVGLLFSIGLIIFLMLCLEKPVNQILTAMNSIEEGNLSIRVNVKSRNEFGMLAGQLNRMVDRIMEDQNELSKLHEEKMNRVDRLATIGELATSLSHEIKNPLAGVLGAVEVLKERTARQDENYDIFNEIIFQLNRLDKTVSNLLAYARPAPFAPVMSNLNEILKHSIFLVNKQAENQKVSIETHLSEIPLFLFDQNQMEQVFLNILLNAIQAMPDGGTLSIHSSVQGDLVRVRVGDTGKGVPPEVRGKIFKPFFTTKTQGTGLGLPISLRILEMHKGKITVGSEGGKGSCFVVELPLTGSND